MSDMNEANIFYIDPRGFKGHLKLVAHDTDVDALLLQQAEASLWLAEHNYLPDGFRSPPPANEGAMPFEPNEPRQVRAAVAPGPAHWIVDVNGNHACSIHGPAKWVPPGTSKATGKPYDGFWGCTEKGCRPQRSEP